MKPRSLPHLHGAMKLAGLHGLCIHRAAGFVLDTPGATLCFGTLDPGKQEGPRGPDDSDEPYIHAWPEWRGEVFAVATIERNSGLYHCSVEDYYRVNAVTDVHRLTRPALLKLAKQIGLSRHLRLGVPAKASVGAVLMEAAGVSYRLTDDGGLVPLSFTVMEPSRVS